MKGRFCDKCHTRIIKEFVKCCISRMEKQTQRLEHCGDLCMDCWKEIYGEEK